MKCLYGGPVQKGPVQKGPVQKGPVQESPVQESPVQEGAERIDLLARPQPTLLGIIPHEDLVGLQVGDRLVTTIHDLLSEFRDSSEIAIGGPAS